MGFNFKNLSPWLDHLSFQWEIFNKYGTEISLEKDRYIFHTGDDLHHIYIVLEGRVRLFYLHRTGKKKRLSLSGEMDY